MKLSNRAQNIAQSEIRAMSILCNEKKGLNMAQGLCDLEVPLPVVQGAKEGIDSGKNTYTSAYGNYKLRAAIAKKQNDFYDQGIEVDNVLVSLGATGAFMQQPCHYSMRVMKSFFLNHITDTMLLHLNP